MSWNKNDKKLAEMVLESAKKDNEHYRIYLIKSVTVNKEDLNNVEFTENGIKFTTGGEIPCGIIAGVESETIGVE